MKGAVNLQKPVIFLSFYEIKTQDFHSNTLMLYLVTLQRLKIALLAYKEVQMRKKNTTEKHIEKRISTLKSYSAIRFYSSEGHSDDW